MHCTLCQCYEKRYPKIDQHLARPLSITARVFRVPQNMYNKSISFEVKA